MWRLPLNGKTLHISCRRRLPSHIFSQSVQSRCVYGPREISESRVFKIILFYLFHNNILKIMSTLLRFTRRAAHQTKIWMNYKTLNEFFTLIIFTFREFSASVALVWEAQERKVLGLLLWWHSGLAFRKVNDLLAIVSRTLIVLNGQGCSSNLNESKTRSKKSLRCCFHVLLPTFLCRF